MLLFLAPSSSVSKTMIPLLSLHEALFLSLPSKALFQFAVQLNASVPVVITESPSLFQCLCLLCVWLPLCALQCFLGPVLCGSREERHVWTLQWGQGLPWLCESALIQLSLLLLACWHWWLLSGIFAGRCRIAFSTEWLKPLSNLRVNKTSSMKLFECMKTKYRAIKVYHWYQHTNILFGMFRNTFLCGNSPFHHFLCSFCLDWQNYCYF